MNKIGFIGGGKMATAIMKGIINSNWCESKNIFVSDKNEEALKILEQDYGVQTTLDNIEVVKNSKIILFAVKWHTILLKLCYLWSQKYDRRHISFQSRVNVCSNSDVWLGD